MESHSWITTLGLHPHPEGGWYREFYRSEETIPHACLPDRFDGDRVFATSIYFMLDAPQFSAFHRIKQDEIWHFLDGAPLTIHQLDLRGRYSTVTLGRRHEAGEVLTAVVPRGTMFGATVAPSRAALVSCTVAPGFDFDDFEMPTREELLTRYPDHRHIITRLTRPRP